MTTQIRSAMGWDGVTPTSQDETELKKLREEIAKRDCLPVPDADGIHTLFLSHKHLEEEAARTKTDEIKCRELLRNRIRDYAQAHKDDCWTKDGEAKVIIPVNGEHMEVIASTMSIQVKRVHVLPITRGIR